MKASQITFLVALLAAVTLPRAESIECYKCLSNGPNVDEKCVNGPGKDIATKENCDGILNDGLNPGETKDDYLSFCETVTITGKDDYRVIGAARTCVVWRKDMGKCLTDSGVFLSDGCRTIKAGTYLDALAKYVICNKTLSEAQLRADLQVDQNSDTVICTCTGNLCNDGPNPNQNPTQNLSTTINPMAEITFFSLLLATSISFTFSM